MQNVDLIIGISVLVILLTCYIIALVKSKRGEMILTSNGWDMALLLICPICLFIGGCFGADSPYITVVSVLWSIAVVCLIGSIIFSIVANKESIWKILCSILAKLFIVLLTIFVLFLLLAMLVFYITIQLVRDRNEDEYILLKYDRFLQAYVGYRV